MLFLALLVAQTPAPAVPPKKEAFTQESSTFGIVVAAAGDQDGDGVPDFFVGEEREQTLDCWLLSGKDGSTLRTLQRKWAFEGWSQVFCAPDVDGDGRAELAICVRPYYDTRQAELLLVSSSRGKDLWSTAVHRPALGDCIRLVQDIDGDKLEDFSLLRHVGTPTKLELSLVSSKSGKLLRTDEFEALRASGHCGFLELPDIDGDSKGELVLLEEGEGDGPQMRVWSPGKRKELWKLDTTSIRFGGMGGALCMLDDVDGDGVRELAASFLDSVHIVSGKTGKSLHELHRESTGDSITRFGEHIVPIGDADGDGCADFAVSETEGDFAGNLYAYSGKSGSRLWAKTPPLETYVIRLGFSLAAVGDVDRDGVQDLIVGSWEATIQAPGYAALVSGKRGSLLLEFRRGPAGVVACTPDPRWPWVSVK